MKAQPVPEKPLISDMMQSVPDGCGSWDLPLFFVALVIALAVSISLHVHLRPFPKRARLRPVT
ncbi:MAG: hypothetical protein IPK66_13280 [Rhodospirillales bacterium]|nr:hypothetical protein [Rhodospirillales bacterium]